VESQQGAKLAGNRHAITSPLKFRRTDLRPSGRINVLQTRKQLLAPRKGGLTPVSVSLAGARDGSALPGSLTFGWHPPGLGRTGGGHLEGRRPAGYLEYIGWHLN